MLKTSKEELEIKEKDLQGGTVKADPEQESLCFAHSHSSWLQVAGELSRKAADSRRVNKEFGPKG